MNNSKDRRNYLNLVWEVEKRLEALKSLNIGKSDNLYLQCNIEAEALQIRKILELIAFASLVSHKDAYSKVRADISKDWHAKRIIKKIEVLNPMFYPVPITSSNNNWNKLKGSFLTKKQFVNLYDKCGTILHVKNPFSKISQRSLAFHNKVPDYISRIENLLSEHLVSLLNKNEILHIKANFYVNKPSEARFLIKSRNF